MLLKLLDVLVNYAFKVWRTPRVAAFRNRLRVLKWRGQFKHLGVDAKIERDCLFMAPYNISIGDHVRIGWGVYFEGAKGSLQVGNNVVISAGSKVLAGSHDLHARKHVDRAYSNPVVIEDNVYIAAGVLILPGVRVGEGAVISAGAVVSRDVPPNMIVAPQRPRVLRNWKSNESRNEL